VAIAVSQWDLDCRKCSDTQKVEHGYCEDSPTPKKWQVKEWTFQRCPLTVVTQQSIDYLNAYPLFKIGVLPNGKGWLNETEKFLQAMRVIEKEARNMERK